jgi:DNA primase
MYRVSESVKHHIKEAVDAESLLRHLGFKISRVTSSEIRAPCKLHGGDNHTAFSLRLETKRWMCFTHNCHEASGSQVDNDLIALVMHVLNLGFTDSLQYLANFAGLSLDIKACVVKETLESKRTKEANAFIQLVNKTNQQNSSKVPTISEDVVTSYIAQRDHFFVDQGFSEKTLDIFEIGAKIDEVGVRRATIPIRDEHGRLISISARREDSDLEPRYKLDKNFQKGRLLYNLHRAIEDKKDYIILVEGFKALWSVYEAGFSSVAACMGTSVSEEQALLLCRFGYHRCFLMFDGDQPGVRGANRAKKRLDKVLSTYIIALPEKKSPDSFSRSFLKDYVSLYV